jgi:hypothetical protein
MITQSLVDVCVRGSVIQVLEETTGVIPWVMGYQKSTVIGFLDLFRLVWTRHK